MLEPRGTKLFTGTQDFSNDSRLHRCFQKQEHGLDSWYPSSFSPATPIFPAVLNYSAESEPPLRKRDHLFSLPE